MTKRQVITMPVEQRQRLLELCKELELRAKTIKSMRRELAELLEQPRSPAADAQLGKLLAAASAE
jgi:hypothetical protein